MSEFEMGLECRVEFEMGLECRVKARPGCKFLLDSTPMFNFYPLVELSRKFNPLPGVGSH